MNIHITTLIDSLNLQDLNPAFSLLLIPIAGVMFFLRMRKEKRKCDAACAKDKNFRFEITGYTNESVKIGLYVSDELSGEDISNILMTALPVIGKKDPGILRLFLYHCLQAMDSDEEVNKAFSKFYNSVS